ncbi:MAG: efflux RND transporter periplasmic adaptor subunit, partial [Candidatus Margulisiibacteriota bacterium]
MIKKYGLIGVLLIIIMVLLIPHVKHDEKKALFYKNPMDPSITSPVFKKDEMGMDYIPVYADEKSSEKPKAGIALPDNHADLLAIKTVTVKRVSMTSSMTAAGNVAYDPELYVAQEEYLQALKAEGGQPQDQDSSQILRASRQKLLLAGMTAKQIDALARNGRPDKNLYQPVSNGSEWIYFNVFEKDASLISVGQTVAIDAVGLPGKTFSAIIRGLTPVIDADTRSLKARAEVSGAAGQLKPGMYITAKVSARGAAV